MGKIDNSFGQDFSGRAGKMIYYTMRGKTYFRSAPTEYRDAKTPEQRQARTRFRSVNAFQSSLMGSKFHEIWKIAAQGESMSGANLFVKSNSAAFDAEGEIGDYSKIHLSAGRLALPDNMSCRTDGEGEVTILWENAYERFSPRYFDRLWVGVLFSDMSFDAVLLDGVNAFRYENHACFRMALKAGVTAHLYCFFASEDADAFSNDWYTKI